MNYKEAVEAYTNKFGGFPYFLCMGMSESDVVRAVKEAIASGEEISPHEGRVY